MTVTYGMRNSTHLRAGEKCGKCGKPHAATSTPAPSLTPTPSPAPVMRQAAPSPAPPPVPEGYVRISREEYRALLRDCGLPEDLTPDQLHDELDLTPSEIYALTALQEELDSMGGDLGNMMPGFDSIKFQLAKGTVLRRLHAEEQKPESERYQIRSIESEDYLPPDPYNLAKPDPNRRRLANGDYDYTPPDVYGLNKK